MPSEIKPKPVLSASVNQSEPMSLVRPGLCLAESRTRQQGDEFIQRVFIAIFSVDTLTRQKPAFTPRPTHQHVAHGFEMHFNA